MIDPCKYDKLITPSLKDIESLSGLLIFIIPFFNELANLLTITIFDPQWNFKLYNHRPTNLGENIQKTIIDFIALNGIIYTALDEFKDTGNIMNGIILGSLYLIFSFVILNLYMYDLLQLAPKDNMIKLILGLLFIYILDLLTRTIMCIYKDRTMSKEVKPKNTLLNSEIILLIIIILIGGLGIRYYI